KDPGNAVPERDRGYGSGAHDEPLEQVEVHAGVVREDQTDDVGVTDGGDDPARVPGGHAVERLHGAALNLAEGLALGEPDRRGRLLDLRPEGGPAELRERAPGPSPVRDLLQLR